MSIKAEKIGQDQSNIFWDNRSDMPIFEVLFQTSTNIGQRFSGVTAPNLTEFIHDAATLNALISCLSAFRYSNPLLNGSAIIKIGREKRRFCVFNWLPWQRPLRDREVNAKFTKRLHISSNLKNLIKIRPMIPQNSLLIRGPLKCEIKKHRQNILSAGQTG